MKKWCLLFVIFGITISTLIAQPDKRTESNKLINSGIQKYNSNDFNGAIFDFTKAIGMDPENALAYYNRGLSKFSLEDYHGAMQDCEKAIKLNVSDPNVYNIRGLTYQALGKNKKAIEDFTKAIELAPESYWGYFNRGIVNANEGNLEAALQDYSKSIEINIEHTESYQNRGAVYYNLGKYQEAITDFNQAVYMNPRNPNIYINRGAAKVALEQYDKAVTDYEEAIKLDAANHNAYYNLGVAYNENGQIDKACWAWDKAKKLGNQPAIEAIEVNNCLAGGPGPVEPINNTTAEFKDNRLEKVYLTEKGIRNYLDINRFNLDPIEGIWSANMITERNKSGKQEKPNFGRVAIIKDTVNYYRDYQMIFLDGSEYFPYTIIAEFTKTSYPMVFLSQVYSLDGLKDAWNFVMDDYGLLKGSKNYMEGPTQVYKELYFVKVYPLKQEVTQKAEPEKKGPSSGSGFLVSKNGIIATNAHVVSGYENITTEFYTREGRETFKATVLYKDETNDVALLRIKDEKFKPVANLPYGIDEKHSVGEDVFTLGFPLAHVMGSEFKAANGIVSAKTGAKDDIRYMQITVPLQPGNSGGPLFNSNGDIIGISSARLTGGTQNVSYSLKAIYLNNLIKMVDNFEGGHSPGSLTGKNLQDQIEDLKYYICLIRAE